MVRSPIIVHRTGKNSNPFGLRLKFQTLPHGQSELFLKDLTIRNSKLKNHDRVICLNDLHIKSTRRNFIRQEIEHVLLNDQKMVLTVLRLPNEVDALTLKQDQIFREKELIPPPWYDKKLRLNQAMIFNRKIVEYMKANDYKNVDDYLKPNSFQGISNRKSKGSHFKSYSYTDSRRKSVDVNEFDYRATKIPEIDMSNMPEKNTAEFYVTQDIKSTLIPKLIEILQNIHEYYHSQVIPQEKYYMMRTDVTGRRDQIVSSGDIVATGWVLRKLFSVYESICKHCIDISSIDKKNFGKWLDEFVDLLPDMRIRRLLVHYDIQRTTPELLTVLSFEDDLLEEISI